MYLRVVVFFTKLCGNEGRQSPVYLPPAQLSSPMILDNEREGVSGEWRWEILVPVSGALQLPS